MFVVVVVLIRKWLEALLLIIVNSLAFHLVKISEDVKKRRFLNGF